MHSTDLIAQLQRSIHTAIGAQAGPFALLDFPDYANVGDSAIWLGEIAYFQQHARRAPDYVCNIHNFSGAAMEKAVPHGPIYLSGGGNFGDIWPSHQNFREMILQRYPGRPVIQLPQSIHYADEANIAASADIINRHGNFLMLVRDQASYDLVKKHFRCKLALCPDMAFCLGPQTKIGKPASDLLLMLRTDKEGMDIGSIPAGQRIEDWVEDDADMFPVARKRTLLQLPFFGLRALSRAARLELYYRNIAQARMDRGIRQLSSARYIITDRLHVHILSTLLNIPHTVMDNSYGKLSRFRSLWTDAADIVTSAPTLQEAIQNRTN